MSLVNFMTPNRKNFTIIFYLAVVVCCYLFFSHQNIPTEIAHSDKYGHILVFFTLALLLHCSTKFSTLQQIALLTSFGIAVEIVQLYIPYRSGSINDVVADFIGIILFHFGARLLVKKLFTLTRNA